MAKIEVPAIRYRQGGHVLYSLVIDAKRIDEIATVEHLAETDDGLVGFQRPELSAHIRGIREFLDGDNPMIPNAIVVGFDKAPRFSPVDKTPDGDLGMLSITRKGLLVDGQQRSAAIRESCLPGFPMTVVAFVAEDPEEFRHHFVLVNSGKGLPPGLLTQLTPGVSGRLPERLEKKRLPAVLLDRLQRDDDSPFHGLIKTSTRPDGLVKDGSILRMLEASLKNGALFFLAEAGDLPGMVDVQKAFWSAVRAAFPDAWGRPPSESRLFHAAGIIGLGGLMDQLAEDLPKDKLTEKFFAKGLRVVKPVCAWAGGEWTFSQRDHRPWNAIENTTRGIDAVKSLLCRTYRASLRKEDGEAA